jgi:hypothetical protein
MLVSRKSRRGRGRAASTGFGIVAVPINNSFIYSSPVSSASRAVIGRPAPYIPIVTSPKPVVAPIGRPAPFLPISGGPPIIGPYAYGGGSYVSNNPSSQNNLAQLTLQYQSNPASLTQLQWQQLQAAGVIPQTTPYSDAAYVTPSSSNSSAIDPATGVPYATELAQAQAAGTAAATTTAAASSSVIGTDPTTGATTIFGIDWYWLAGGLALLYVFTGKRR